jgi:hypothetical protein
MKRKEDTKKKAEKGWRKGSSKCEILWICMCAPLISIPLTSVINTWCTHHITECPTQNRPHSLVKYNSTYSRKTLYMVQTKNLANDTLSKLNFIHKPLWKLTRDVRNGLLSQICRFVPNQWVGPVLREALCICFLTRILGPYTLVPLFHYAKYFDNHNQTRNVSPAQSFAFSSSLCSIHREQHIKL